MKAVTVLAILALGPWMVLADSSERLDSAAKELDLIVARIDPREIASDVAKLLEIKTPEVERILVELERPLSDLACAVLIARKTKRPLDQIITDKSPINWLPLFNTAKITLDAGLEHLDEVHTEIAFLAFDWRSRQATR